MVLFFYQECFNSGSDNTVFFDILLHTGVKGLISANFAAEKVKGRFQERYFSQS